MEYILKKKIQHLEKELKIVKEYTLEDVIQCETDTIIWRNRYLKLKEYCIYRIPEFESIVDIFDETYPSNLSSNNL